VAAAKTDVHDYFNLLLLFNCLHLFGCLFSRGFRDTRVCLVSLPLVVRFSPTRCRLILLSSVSILPMISRRLSWLMPTLEIDSPSTDIERRELGYRRKIPDASTRRHFALGAGQVHARLVCSWQISSVNYNA